MASIVITWQAAIDGFLDEQKLCRLAKSTIRIHKDQLRCSQKELEALGIAAPTQITEKSLRRMMTALIALGKAPSTQRLRRQSLLQLCDWLVSQGYITENPVTRIPKPRELGDREPRAVDDDTARRFLNAPSPCTFVGIRDRAIIWLMYDSGMSRCEIAGLKTADFDDRIGIIHVRREVRKTRHARQVPVSDAVKDQIMKYLKRRPVCSHDYLFVTEPGDPISWDTIDHRFVYYSRKVGTKITPHMMRHSFARGFLIAGGGAMTLKDLLGHRTLRSTMVYTRFFANDLIEQHRKFSPLQRLSV